MSEFPEYGGFKEFECNMQSLITGVLQGECLSFLHLLLFFPSGEDLAPHCKDPATKLPQPKPVNRPLQPLLTIRGWGRGAAIVAQRCWQI